MRNDGKQRRPGTASRPEGQSRAAGRPVRPPAGSTTAKRSAAAPGRKRKRKRRISRFHMLMALLLALVVVAASVTIFLLLAPRTPVPGAEDGRKTAIFGIGRITVEGDTRYASADIIEKSGAFLGQSVFTLDKKGMAERVLEAFPYIEKVAVDSPSFDHVRITVSEVALLGAVSAGESWWMIGTNNKLLERLPSGEAVPEGLMQLKGQLASDQVGGQALEKSGFEAAVRLLEAIRRNEIEGIVGLDVADPSDLRLNWRNQIILLLGGDVNLDYEMKVAAATIRTITGSYGEGAKGQIDMRSYSDADSSNDEAVYIPQDILDRNQAS